MTLYLYHRAINFQTFSVGLEILIGLCLGAGECLLPLAVKPYRNAACRIAGVAEAWRKPLWDWSLLRGGIVNLISEYKIIHQTLWVPRWNSLPPVCLPTAVLHSASKGDHLGWFVNFSWSFPHSFVSSQWGGRVWECAWAAMLSSSAWRHAVQLCATWPPCTPLCVYVFLGVVGGAQAYVNLYENLTREVRMLEWERVRMCVHPSKCVRACLPGACAHARVWICVCAYRQVTFHSRAHSRV